MDRNLDFIDSQAVFASSAIDSALTCEPACDLSHEPPLTDNLDGYEPDFEEGERSPFALLDVGDALSLEPWLPTDPQFCKDIAAHYQQSKRTIQKWFVDLREIAPWFTESELRLHDDRYTPLAVKLLGDRYFAGSKKLWAEELATQYADRVADWNATQSEPAIRPDVLPPHNESSTGDRPAASESLLPTGRTFLNALQEEEAELSAVEARELVLIGRMGEGLTRLTHASQQWQQASQLRRQRLLRETRLEAASLAVELEEEFENTLRETQYHIQHGNVPMPGKPPSPTPRSPSA
jgi:hypothetical protein